MKLDNIIKILAILLVLLTCIISVNSLRGSIESTNNINKENFVNISIIGYSEIDPCEPIEIDSESCFFVKERIDLFENTASGLVIDSSELGSRIITAHHFCSSFLDPGIDRKLISDINLSLELVVIDTSSNRFYGKIEKFNIENDLCLIEIEEKILGTKNIKFKRGDPEIGDKVNVIASPLSMSKNGVLLTFEGIYSGCNAKGTCFYTVPATGGSSGSIVFDKRGNAIGMIQAVPVEFQAVSIGVNSDTIIRFLNE